jgi:hypothetical protein
LCQEQEEEEEEEDTPDEENGNNVNDKMEKDRTLAENKVEPDEELKEQPQEQPVEKMDAPSWENGSVGRILDLNELAPGVGFDDRPSKLDSERWHGRLDNSYVEILFFIYLNAAGWYSDFRARAGQLA